MTYVYDQYVFHYIVEAGICYLCMSDELNKHRIPYAFLQDIKETFVAQYGREVPLKAIAFSMNDQFSKVIDERMNYFNSDNPAVDNIANVKSQIDEVKDVMVQNIEKVLERGEKIELLVDKTDRLNQQAFRFESTSRNLRRTLWWKKLRTMAVITTAISLFVFFVASRVCGGIHFDRCRRHHH